MKLKLEKLEAVEADATRVGPNIDPKAVARLVRKHEAAMRAELRAATEAQQREVDHLELFADPGLVAIDREKAVALGQRLRADFEAVSSEEAPNAEPLDGHNPNLFAPFFNAGGSATVGGVTTTPIFRRRPDIGLLACSVAAYPPGGHVDRRLFMGAFTFAPSEEMVTATVSTFVAGTIGAFTVLGYGRASARLIVSVSAEGARGFTSVSSSVLIADTAFGVTRRPLSNLVASTRLLVRAGDLVLVACGLQVTAGCGGIACGAVSNVAISGTSMCLV